MAGAGIVVSSPPRARAWQRMLSGRRLDLIEPSPLDIEIGDIAHGLARVARWNGQTGGKHAFSVAQHSVIVWQVFLGLRKEVTPDEELAALLHDGPEYVIGDMISPFKAVLGGEYKQVEQRLQSAIHRRFSLPENDETLKKRIKRADSISAYFEATELAGFSQSEARRLFGTPRGFTAEALGFAPVPADRAQKMFLEAFEKIEQRRTGHGS